MAEGTIQVVRCIGEHSSAVTIDAVDPPQATVTAEVVGLVVRDLSRAERPLAGNHVGRLFSSSRNRVGERTGHCHDSVLAVDQLSPVPVALVQIEHPEPSEVPHGNGDATGTVPRAERHHRRSVFALDQIGQEGMKHFLVDVVVGGTVDLEEKRVPKQRHLPVVVGKRRTRLFDQTVTRYLIGHMAPGDRAVLEAERLVDPGQSRLPPSDRLVEAFDSTLFESLEQEMRIEGFARRSHVGSPANVSPRIDQIPVPDDAAAPADEPLERLQLLGVRPHFPRRFPLPSLPRKHRIVTSRHRYAACGHHEPPWQERSNKLADDAHGGTP